MSCEFITWCVYWKYGIIEEKSTYSKFDWTLDLLDGDLISIKDIVK